MNSPQFIGQKPIFKLGFENELDLFWRPSPYYWWWQYLRRSERYRQCCVNNGNGELSTLYSDFGDVQVDDFRKWWHEDDRGVRLFAQSTKDLGRPFLITSESDIKTEDKDFFNDYSVVAIPRSISLRSAQNYIKSIYELRQYEKKRGRTSVRAKSRDERYPLASNFDIENLEVTLAVYDSWLNAQRLPVERRPTLWKIGTYHFLNILAIKALQSKDKYEVMDAKKLLSTLTSRYIRHARLLIANAELGKFPLKKPVTPLNKSPQSSPLSFPLSQAFSKPIDATD